jgi:hypothetical protein
LMVDLTAAMLAGLMENWSAEMRAAWMGDWTVGSKADGSVVKMADGRAVKKADRMAAPMELQMVDAKADETALRMAG